jgi:hypothetical protein
MRTRQREKHCNLWKKRGYASGRHPAGEAHRRFYRAMTVLKGGRCRVKADVGLQVKISPISNEVTLIELG